MDSVLDWELSGEHHVIGGHHIFVRDKPNAGMGETLLFIHGFPTCSYDWRHVIPALTDRRIVILDMLGYGLSDKPLDHHYSLFEQADIVQAVAELLDLRRCVLITHDVGDSVGGELCARALDGTLPFEITKRVMTNGTIYMDLVQLSPGQQLLLAMPDEALPEDAALTEELFRASMTPIFGPETQPSADELAAQWELLSRHGGNRILPKLIRYIEERKIHEGRWTGAIEKHPAPLTIVWGDADPIAVYPMAERLKATRSDAELHRLQGVGHFPMIEDPAQVAQAIARAL